MIDIDDRPALQKRLGVDDPENTAWLQIAMEIF
jgi:hypothetical protein